MVKYLQVSWGSSMTKFESLYEMASKIRCKFDELFYLTVNKSLDASDVLEKEKLIEELKILILGENDFVSKMETADIDLCLSEIRSILESTFKVSVNDDLNTLEGMEIYLKELAKNIGSLDLDKCEWNIDVLLRVFNRLKNRTYILWDENVNLKLRQDNQYIVEYEVSVWDAVMSILNIEVAKKVWNKIVALRPYSEDDKKFISDLKCRFRTFQMRALYANFASEMQALYAGNDLDRIVVGSIDKLKKLKVLDQDTFNSLLLNEAECLIEDLSMVGNMPYDSECVFAFVKTVTMFENLIPYMGVDLLKQVYDYSKSLTSDKNYPCMSGINDFVKAKIKHKSM